jgi:hypothetical protein
VTTVVFFPKKGGHLENNSYDFFIRIVNNDGYICVVTLEIVKKKLMQLFSKNLKPNISITLTLKTLSCNFITGL